MHLTPRELDKLVLQGAGTVAQKRLARGLRLAPHVGADLGVMQRDAGRMRGDGPTIFAQVVHGIGVDDVASLVLSAWSNAR